jgi:type I restriction-modification system DNA methylase subunit
MVDQAAHNKIVSSIWGIADDVLRDLFKRGKYPDVILPMCVIRRMDAVLEPAKKQVLETKASRCARWKRSAPTSSRSRRKPKDCWTAC